MNIERALRYVNTLKRQRGQRDAGEYARRAGAHSTKHAEQRHDNQRDVVRGEGKAYRRRRHRHDPIHILAAIRVALRGVRGGVGKVGSLGVAERTVGGDGQTA